MGPSGTDLSTPWRIRANLFASRYAHAYPRPPDRNRKSILELLACAFGRLYESLSMFIVHVFVQVKPECLEAFREATIENARNSIQESGVVRFDFIQQRNDPTQFVLVEVYRTEADTASHKRTAHYAKWQATVENLLAQPRSRIFYQNIFPEDTNW